MATGEEDVYCTLVMTDSYLPGAAVLAHSLRDNGAKKKLAVIVTLESLRASTLTELKSLYDYVIPVERIGNPNPSNLYLMNRSDLLYAFTKINLWRLTQFRKVVYIDADVVALRAPDELFDLPASFAAAPDVGWPDAFNTGIMALTPHMGDYWALKTLAATGDSFDGADQGLLNQYFEHKDWHRLSFTYNCTPSANYQYEPAYRYHKSRINLVHFIGKNKPWDAPRSQHAAPGAYNELLARWWAVYDRHFKESASDYASGSYTPASNTSKAVQSEPEASVITTESSMTDPGEHAENISQGLTEPTSTREQRRFSAPQTDWDATRAPPPHESKPEAANFPSQTYVFNEDPGLFRAPKAYPEPPKDMWYEVPKEKPASPSQKPPPIFPWEEREPAKPTRRFVDDVTSPEPTPSLLTTTSTENSPPSMTPTPTIKITHDDPWEAFSGGATRNAWDEVNGIDAYVRALAASQKSRGKVQTFPGAGQDEVTSPQATRGPERRESLILTHFPSEVDRPSLPVTPAPMRRPSFWGEERDQAGELPSAQGVPDQAEWNPTEKLEDLRRNSLMGPADLKLPAKKIPNRQMPPSAPAALDAATQSQLSSITESNFAAPSSSTDAEVRVPTFASVDFAGSAATSQATEANKDHILSPTEYGSRTFG